MDSTGNTATRSQAVRIVLAGTQSVGKTTLAGDLAEAWPRARIEEEPIRAVARETGEAPPAVPTLAAERRIIEYGLGRLRSASTEETVIFDRSPLDAYAHAILSMEIGGPIDPPGLAELRPPVIEAMNLADLVVLVPLEFGIGNEEDGFRYLDESNRRRVDRILADLLRPESGVRRGPVAIARGDRPTRVEQVVRLARSLS